MTLFRHISNGGLYLIQEVVKDICYTNRNAFAGLVAEPYYDSAPKLYTQTKSPKEKSDFLENFKPAAII